MRGRDIENPWDLVSSQCKLNCGTGYWANWESTYNSKGTDVWDQRCTSFNCKNWNYGSELPANTAKTCTICWDWADITDYANWDAKSTYKEQEMTGALQSKPFSVDLTTKNCELHCAAGYWSNWQSKVYPNSDEYDQRCTSDNCKSWNHAADSAAEPSTKCTECFTQAEMLIYNNWDARGSYPEFAVEFRKLGTLVGERPWELTSNECILHCQDGYWSNISIVTNVLDQNCIYDNCKTWNTAVGVKSCTSCWAHGDLIVWDTWLGRGSYTVSAIMGRVSTNPWVLENDKCILNCGDEFWLDYRSSDPLVVDRLLARCSSRGCKDWDSTGAGHPLDCTDCWKKEDIFDQLTGELKPDWPGLTYYNAINMQYARTD